MLATINDQKKIDTDKQYLFSWNQFLHSVFTITNAIEKILTGKITVQNFWSGRTSNTHAE